MGIFDRKRINQSINPLTDQVFHLVEEVRTQSSVAAQPLVRAVFTALNNVAGDHATTVPEGCLPVQLHRILVLVLPGQILWGTRRLCTGPAETSLELQRSENLFVWRVRLTNRVHDLDRSGSGAGFPHASLVLSLDPKDVLFVLDDVVDNSA